MVAHLRDQKYLSGSGQSGQTAGRTRYQVSRPNQSNQERLVDEALQISAMPGAYLQDYQPRERVLFPPRFGWEDEPATIDDVLMTEWPNPSFPNKGPRNTHAHLVSEAVRKRARADQRVEWSGGPAGFSGTSRPSMSGWF